MSCIGVFGGSFDPPTLGHTLAALWALEAGPLDRLLVIPNPEHAFGKERGAPFEARVELCRIAFARLAPHVAIDGREGRRTGPAYMIDTLRELRAEHPGDELRLVIGSDLAAEVVPRWREGLAVVTLARPLVVPRLDASVPIEDQPGALPLVSSTAARDAIREGKETRHLLAAEVADAVKALNLYRG
jgi:nicotinate-nucleotide adenylyltransferase